MKAKNIIGLISSIAVLVTCIIIAIVLMHGETKTFGENPADIEGRSLVCKNQDIRYPFFDYDGSNSRDLEITANFYNEALSAISLAYTLYYDTTQEIVTSEAKNHADMNISFGKNGLSPDSFNAHYSKLDDSLKMSLYVTTKDLTPTAAKYFMITLRNQTSLPSTITEYQKSYEEQGFTCTLSS